MNAPSDMNSKNPKKATGGGSAAQTGISFQNRVAAWVAVRILCDVACTPIFGLAAIPTLFRCETEQPVDDLLVGSRIDSFAYAQIKHSIDLSDSPSSPLADVIDQFQRQILANRGNSAQQRPWDRKPDPARDALVLIVGPGSSGQIREHLRNVLAKLRQLLPQQSLSEAASNAQESKALQAVAAHFSRSYQTEVGTAPLDADVRNALRLMHVEVLDVDPNGQGEREALDALRQVVLRNEENAPAAWATLVQACAHLAETHSGADQAALQRLLLAAGFELNIPASYNSDIEQLRGTTARTEAILSDLSKIRVADTIVSIDRAVTQEIHRLAETSHTLVVGEPGAGKSGALAHFVDGLRARDADFVVLAVDRMGAGTEAQLQAELHLEHFLDEVLENWPGTRPGFLVIDALDAARGGPAAKTIRELIGRVSSRATRWRVVASIRKFDLRYSQELRDLFAIKGAVAAELQFRDDSFSTVSHVNVRPLSEEELARVQTQSPLLATLITQAPAELQKLLRIPFNLRLLGELLGTGMTLEQLTPVRTQLDLLDKYWSKRVIGEDTFGYAREDLLRRACEGMTAARVLRVDLSEIADAAGSPSLHNLLSAHVLMEWQPSPEHAPNRYVVAFSHHVLFDYSAARLLLRGNRATLVRRIEQEPEVSLILRPSFVLHFQHLWNEESPTSFWEFAFQIVQSSQVVEIGKLIGPSAAVDLVHTISDFEALLAKLNAADETTRRLGEEVLQHLIGAVLVAPRDAHPLIGPSAGPWAELAERVSRNLHVSSAYALRPLLTASCEERGGWSSGQLAALGAASRRLLEFAWSTPRRDEWLVNLSMQCVCRTFDSDPASSAALIRRALVLDHLRQYGFEEMPWLAREAHTLMQRDPVLVEEIYITAFQFRDESDAPTAMNPSRILRLSGNRRQDYGMARYQLAAVFPQYQATFPENATRAAIAAVEGYVREERSLPSDSTPEAFDFRGVTTHILTDYSSIWDGQMSTQHEDSIKLLDVFTQHCDSLVAEGRLDEFKTLLDVVAKHNRLAVFWRRLLGLAAKYPATISIELVPLAKASAVLTAIDTTQPTGEFLHVCFPILPPAERESIERTILSLPESGDSARRSYLEQIRNRLLGCIALEDLVTQEAKAMLTMLTEANAVPENEPPVRFSGAYSQAYGEREYLRDQGVKVESTANARIQELEQSVVSFAAKFANSNPSSDDVQTALPALRALHDALLTADRDGVDPKQSDYAWGVLAEAAERIARWKDLSCDEPPGKFVKEVLITASKHPNPQPNPRYDAQFDESPSWGGPSARISAAQGLTALAQFPSCATPDVLDAVERLSRDPVAPVRFQVAIRLVSLYRTDQARMWKVIRSIGADDQSTGVLSGLLQPTIGQISGAHPQEVAEFIRSVISRGLSGPGADSVRNAAVGILCGLRVWQAHPLSGELLDTFIADPRANAELLSQLELNLRNVLSHGAFDATDSREHAIRRRALDLFLRIVRSAKGQLRELEGTHSETPFDEWPDSDKENTKRLVRVLDHAATELYFASGAFNDRGQNRLPGQRELTADERRRFFEETTPIVEALSDLGFPAIAHHLLQTLESFISFEPRKVFLSVGDIVRAAVGGGYQFEQMAADLVVRLVERYLAEYREMLQESPDCRRVLVELLDTFIRAGWSSARQLTYRLEEIFR
jgi:signal recognition particle GTPase